MLEQVVKDYSAYLKLNLTCEFQSVQDVIDNMLTRLEELSSVLLMIRMKNSDCSTAVTGDICKYRNEINMLSKKITMVNKVVTQLKSNMDHLEKLVEKAETDFGTNQDNKLKSFLKPFLMKSKETTAPTNLLIVPPEQMHFDSILDNFEVKSTSS